MPAREVPRRRVQHVVRGVHGDRAELQRAVGRGLVPADAGDPPVGEAGADAVLPSHPAQVVFEREPRGHAGGRRARRRSPTSASGSAPGSVQIPALAAGRLAADAGAVEHVGRDALAELGALPVARAGRALLAGPRLVHHVLADGGTHRRLPHRSGPTSAAPMFGKPGNRWSALFRKSGVELKSL